MKRLSFILLGFAAILSAQSGGAINGILTNANGGGVSGAIVSAYLQATSTGGMPPVFNALTGSDGSFSLNGLQAGTYLLCAENVSVALLNPCFWSTSQTNFTVGGASATGVSLVAQIGVALNILINDPTGLLAANPTLDDLLIGVRPTAKGPVLPARILSKNSTGRTMAVLVPEGALATLLVYSANFSLSDTQGDSFSASNVTLGVTAPKSTSPSNSTNGATATPALTINILGLAQH